MTVIGLIGPADDDEVRTLAARIRDRGAEPWVLDLSRFPADLRLRLDDEGVTVEGRSLREMAAAYLRQSGIALPPRVTYLDPVAEPADAWRAAYADTAVALGRERRSHAVRTAVLAWLAQRRPVVNPPVPQNLHRLKGWFLERLRRAGLAVPAFALGSARPELEAFARRHGAAGAGAVLKPMAGIYKTHHVDDERTRAHPWGRRPALLQRYLPGDTVRCYVVQGRLLTAARIVHGGTVDSSESQTGIEVLELPAAARTLAEETAATLDLAFCGMDLMRASETGEWFVIDCNLAPMFVAYGRLSRVDVAGHLAELLLERAGFRPDARRAAVLDLVGEAKSLLADDPDIARRVARIPPSEPDE